MRYILEISDLSVEFPTRSGVIRVVDRLSLCLRPGERLGLVGESGSGKSITLLSVLGLVPSPGRVVQGEILYRGRNLLRLKPNQLQALRGKDLAMVFQDPMTTLNPVFPVGEQIRESLRVHGFFFRRRLFPFGRSVYSQERKRVLHLMAEVGIPSPEERYGAYPHEFSGGMQQRAMIAIALACDPEVLLLDEPTTALDVTIQAQIMALLDQTCRRRGTAIVLVTHDLSLAAEFCDRIAVMYAGKVVEEGPVDDVIRNPRHPYTQGLLAAIPQMGHARRIPQAIPGEVDLAVLPKGCPFAPRCTWVMDRCWLEMPEYYPVGSSHKARCFLNREAKWNPS